MIYLCSRLLKQQDATVCVSFVSHLTKILRLCVTVVSVTVIVTTVTVTVSVTVSVQPRGSMDPNF